MGTKCSIWEKATKTVRRKKKKKSGKKRSQTLRKKNWKWQPMSGKYLLGRGKDDSNYTGELETRKKVQPNSKP